MSTSMRTRTPAAPPHSPSRGTKARRAAQVTRGALDNGLALAVLVVAVLAGNALSSFDLLVLTQTLVFAVALFSIVVLTGYVGQISLCQASFMGLGGYLVGALMAHLGWSYWLAAPVAVAAVFLVGVLVGLPALRLRGLTLAIVTLSLALLADNFLFTDVGWLNNNSQGWTIKAPSLFGVALDSDHSTWLYRVILLVTVVAVLVVLRLRRGRTGKSWYAMRDAEIAAATSGVPVVTMKLLAFGIGAALAASAGALYILAYGSVSADPFNFVTSIKLLALAVIAGTRSLPGAVLGAAFYIIFPQILLNVPGLESLTALILGAGLIVQVIAAPQGVGGLLESAETRLFRWLAHGGRSDTPIDEEGDGHAAV